MPSAEEAWCLPGRNASARSSQSSPNSRFGPLEVAAGPTTRITEIMVNGPKNIFVERKGNITRANISFEDDEHVLRILDRIVCAVGTPCGRKLAAGRRPPARRFARERRHFDRLRWSARRSPSVNSSRNR